MNWGNNMIKLEVTFKKDDNGFDAIECNGKIIEVYESCGFLSAYVDGKQFDTVFDAVAYCVGK